ALRQLPAQVRRVEELLAGVLRTADQLLLRVEEIEGRGRSALRLRLDGFQQVEEIGLGDDAAVVVRGRAGDVVLEVVELELRGLPDDRGRLRRVVDAGEL